MAVLLPLCWLLFFYQSDQRDLWSSHEGRAAQNAQSMLLSGDWRLPRLFDGQVELQKPPLYYWLVALTGQACGGTVDARAVRFPAALSAVLLVLGVFGFLLAQGRPEAAWRSALFLATMQHFTWLARIGRIDLPLTCSVGLVLLAVFQAAQAAAPWRWMLVAWLALAAGILLKGPIALVLPAAVLTVWMLVEKQRVPLGLLWGVPLLAAVVVPWFVWANAATEGDLVRVFFWKHNVARGFGGDEDLATNPSWFYAPRLLFDTLPGSLLLPFAVLMTWRTGWRELDPIARFGLIWVGTIFVVLSCFSFKRADYLLPAYPGLALWLGCTLERKLGRTLLTGSMLCTVGWLFFVTSWLPTGEAGREYRQLAAAIRQRCPAPGMVIFFRTEAHALAFHIGPRVETILQWENLDIWASRTDTSYLVVMPPEIAADWPNQLHKGRLEPVLDNRVLAGGTHEKPLLVLRTIALADRGSSDGRLAPAPSHQGSGTQSHPAGTAAGGAP